jgi:drug/metabolite transporter (DMT)-like permease
MGDTQVASSGRVGDAEVVLGPRAGNSDLASNAPAGNAASKNRGRALALGGMLLISCDAPSFRLVHLHCPLEKKLSFGLSVLMWRCVLGSLVTFSTSVRMAGGLAGLVTQIRLLGPKTFGALTVSQLLGTFAVVTSFALTSAANVLVVLALSPLVTALLSRFYLGAQLPPHTWIAIIVAFACLAGALIGEMGGDSGALLFAALGPAAFGTFFTLAESRKDVDTSIVVPFSLGSLFLLMLATLAARGALPGAMPARPADVFLLLFNAASVNLGVMLLSLGATTAPGAEIALLTLLEPVLSPILVYILVGERPSTGVAAAGVLIVFTLALHAVYDSRVEKRKEADAQAAALMGDGVELLERGGPIDGR